MSDRAETEASATRWIEGYLRAWASNDADDIRALFTEGAPYFTAPWREPWRGAEAIAEGWIGRLDEPGSWEFDWEIVGIDGSRAFVKGETRYPDAEDYSNLWIIDLAPDGRARSFTEFWMTHDDSTA